MSDASPSEPHLEEQFISEAIAPTVGTFDTSAMSRGEPGLPQEFSWRGRVFQVANLQSTWKTSTRERGELYLRRHWFDVLTTTGERMTLYCERQSKSGRSPKSRWWLYKMREV